MISDDSSSYSTSSSDDDSSSICSLDVSASSVISLSDLSEIESETESESDMECDEMGKKNNVINANYILTVCFFQLYMQMCLVPAILIMTLCHMRPQFVPTSRV